MRLFLGIEIPEKAKKLLEKQLTEYKIAYRDVNWIPEQNLHITIHFFGEVDDVDMIKEKLESVLYDTHSFYLFSLGADLSINKFNLRLFVEIKRDKKMDQLVERVDELFPITKKNEFSPHISLAKYRIPSKQQYYLMKKKLQRTPIDIEIPVNQVYLYSSDIRGKVPVYTKLAEFPLIQGK